MPCLFLSRMFSSISFCLKHYTKLESISTIRFILIPWTWTGKQKVLDYLTCLKFKLQFFYLQNRPFSGCSALLLIRLFTSFVLYTLVFILCPICWIHCFSSLKFKIPHIIYTSSTTSFIHWVIPLLWNVHVYFYLLEMFNFALFSLFDEECPAKTNRNKNQGWSPSHYSVAGFNNGS